MKNLIEKLLKTLLCCLVPMLSWSCDGSKSIVDDEDKSETKIVRMSVASFNVLSVDKDENAAQNGGAIRYWSNRKGTVAHIINRGKFSVVGVQELNHQSMKDELSALLPTYAFTEDAKNDPIFWLKDDFTLLDKGEFLADNGPYRLDEAPSSYWGKFVVWVKLKENRTGKSFFVFNGHPIHDPINTVYRSAFARELVRNEKIINQEKLPAFFVGDFNAHDDRGNEDHDAKYNEIFGEAGFANGMLAARVKINEEYGTWAGFGRPGDYAWLDRIYVSKGDATQISVQRYEAVIDFDPNRSGYRIEPIPSDHFPIYINVELTYK